MDTVTVIEKWWPGRHVKYIELKSGEKIVLESDSERPPFVFMERFAGTIAGNVGESR